MEQQNQNQGYNEDVPMTNEQSAEGPENQKLNTIEQKFVQWWVMKDTVQNVSKDDGPINWEKIERVECLKIELFYNMFIEAAGSRDPLVQFDKNLIYDLGQMCRFKDEPNLEDTQFLVLKDIPHYPIRRERQDEDIKNVEWKQFDQIANVYNQQNPTKPLRKSKDIVPIIQAIIQHKFDQNQTMKGKNSNGFAQFFKNKINEMFEQVWKEDLPEEKLKVDWCWNRADTGQPENFQPYESINHQRKIEEAYKNGYEIAEILVEITQNVDGKDRQMKVPYTIRLSKETQTYQQHRTGDPTLFRQIKRIEQKQQ